MNEERFNKNRYAYGYEVPLNVPTQSVPVITDTLDGKHYYSLREVVNLLNDYEKNIVILTMMDLPEMENMLIKQSSIIRKDEIAIKTMMSNMEKLEKENEQLRKENKQLQTELDNFRPVIFHTMQRGTITLYSKGGINE